MKNSSMGRKAPFKSSKKFEYSITYSFYDEESLEFGESFDSGYEVEPEVESISEILYTAWGKYGIYYPVSIGTWEATDVPEDRDFYEKGIRKYYVLHLKNEDGTEISEEDNDFVTHILSNGEYNRDYFEEFALGGFLSGSTNDGLSWKLDRAKFNKGESYEIPMSKRKAMGGDADERELIQLRINNLKSLVNVMSDEEEIAQMQGVIARLERERDAMKYAGGGGVGITSSDLKEIFKKQGVKWEDDNDFFIKAYDRGYDFDVEEGLYYPPNTEDEYAGGGDIEWNYWKIEKNNETIYERTNLASPNIPNAKKISKEEYDNNVKKSYKNGGEVYFNGMSKKEILDATVVFDNNGDTLDRYTVFTPDGSVFGMSENASGFNQYIGEDDEVEQGEHLGRKLKSVPKNIQSAVLIRMIEEYKEGGFINKISDLPEDSKIRIDFVEVQVYEDSYDEGEGENTYNYSINVDGDSIPTKSLVEFLSNAIGTSDNPNDYMLDDGIVQTSELQDKDGNKPSKSEIESWKKGQTELFTANYLISISLIAEIEASDEVLSDLTGIETYKRGGSVKSKKPKKFKLKREPKVARNMFEESVYEFGRGGNTDNKRNINLHDSVLYKGETWYFTEKNGVKGISNYSQGAWGTNFPFIPVSKINPSDVTDMMGRSVMFKYADGGITEMTKGFYKGYSKFKDKIIIPLGVSASKNGLDRYKMPKTTVEVGFKLAEKIKMSYQTFDLAIKDDEIVLLLTPLGQRTIKVNVELKNYTFDFVINAVKESLKEYLSKNKYDDGGEADELLEEIGTHKAIKKGNKIYIYLKGLEIRDAEDKETAKKYPHWYEDELIRTIPAENKDDLFSIFENFKEENRINLAQANGEFSKGGGVEGKLSYEEFVETLRDNDKINFYSPSGRTTTGMEMYYLPSGHPFLGMKFPHKNKRKAYNEYLKIGNKIGFDSGFNFLSMAKGGGVEDYLSNHQQMFSDSADTLTKKQVIDFIKISKNSDDKFWIKDSNGYSKYLYKGQLRANDSTEGIFYATKIDVDKLNDSYKYKIHKENLYEYEKEDAKNLDSNQNIVKKPINSKNKNWSKYVKDNKSYFDLEEETEDTIQLTTRQNGSVYDEKFGAKDMQEAKSILKKIKDKFPNTHGNIYTVDEFVYLELEAPEKMAKGGGVYSSDEMYQLSVFDGKTNELLTTKRFTARNQREANEMGEEYESSMQNKYGDYLRFKVELAPSMMKDGGEISIWELRKGDKVKTRKGNIETIERKIESGYFTKESEYSHSFESLEFVSRPKRKYDEGGEVEEWMNDALKELRDYTDNNSLKIEDVYDDDYFLASDGSEEYLVFEDFDEAHEYAVEDVKSNLESNAEYFQRDWLMGHLEAGNYLRNVYDEWNMGYATDIMTEDDDKYPNRLIAEMVQWGIMDSDEAKGSDAEEIANDRMEDFVNALTDDQINQGNDGFDYYIDNFGEDEAFKMALENNLIDIEGASEDAVSVDGVAHFISSYDGEEIVLDGGSYAYRIN